jgi:hypothetical protein
MSNMTDLYKDCTIKYVSTSLKENDHIQIIYPKDSNGEGLIKCVPINNNNTDYQNILKWVDEGNTIQEAD